MIIRRMEEKDMPQVVAIEQELFSDAWSEAAFYDTMQQSAARILVAELSQEEVKDCGIGLIEETAGTIAGYCISYQALDESEIVNVAVGKKYQNRGTGYRLVEELMEQDEANGVCNFILEVRAGNRSAQHVYGKLGFNMIGIRKNFYDRPVEDAWIMQRVISNE